MCVTFCRISLVLLTSFHPLISASGNPCQNASDASSEDAVRREASWDTNTKLILRRVAEFKTEKGRKMASILRVQTTHRRRALWADSDGMFIRVPKGANQT